MTVLIVGGGPTGLVTACALVRRGVPVRVLDAAAGPATTSRALGVQVRGVEVLTRIGALGDLPDRGMWISSVRAMAGGRQLMDLRLPEWGRRKAVLIGQSEVEAQLRRRLSDLGGKVEWGVRVTGVEQDSTGVTVHAGEEEIRGDWLVGCDGAHSAVRKLAGIGFPGVPLAERFLLADVHMDWGLPREGVTTWLGSNGMYAAFPLPGKDLWRLQADLPGSGDVDVLAELRRLLPERTGRDDAKFGKVEWTSTFTIQRRLADSYRRGRIFLAGDAAHIHSPFSGQGMNTGIGDAENLAWKLAMVAGGTAGERLLDTYQAERRPVAEEVLEGTTALTNVVLGTTPLLRLLRDVLILPLVNLEPVQRRFFQRASQLSVTYRGGPLAARGAGQRVAEVASSELDGRWALLVPDASDPHVAVVRQRLGDDVVVLADGKASARLVRPDAHLAWRGRRSPARLGAWLDAKLS